ncbi:sel1 repeat family protein [Providencia rettgeri]|nr:sel1 repeat family protein [Providencia rettgeri]
MTMTKPFKVGLFILIIIAVAIGIYFVNTTNSSSPSQLGYDLYQQGESQAAFEQFQKNADKDSQSAFALAMMYKEGIGTKTDDVAAQNWLIKAAEANNKNALYNLGFFRYKHLIEDTSTDENGLTSLTKAADLGVKEAQEMVGGIYLADKYEQVPQNIELSRQYFTLASEQGSKLAKFALGYIAHDFENDSKKAVEILTPLVSNDFPLPAMLLASIYEEGGNGVPPNPLLAKKYERLSFSSALEYISDASELEPGALSLYGSQTEEEKQKVITNLEERASRGDENAIYALYQKYMTGDGVRRNKNRAMVYLRPLVEAKHPKALYLNYKADTDRIQDLTDAADGQYPPAMYQAYNVYSGRTFSDVKRNDALAEKYLTAAADLGDLNALVTINQRAISSYDFPNKKLSDTVAKYTPILMEKYPNSAEALVAASDIYSAKGSPLFSPEKAFATLEKANRIDPTYDAQMQLARYYINAFGTKQDVQKAAKLLIDNLNENDYPSTADRLLVQVYYRYDIKALIDEKTIVDILKNDVIKRENYALAYLYADYLLKEDAEKNSVQAFDLYEKSIKQNYNSQVYYAAALLKYRPTETNKIANLIVNVLHSPQAQAELLPSQLQIAKDILLKTGLNRADTKALLVKMALYENHAEAQKLIEPLINKDADITYLYGINKLTQLTNVDTLSDAEIKPLYDYILKAAELGSASAYLYIAQNLDGVTYHNDKAYYKSRFQQITGLTAKDLVPQYKKCAALKNNRCLYELGEIYQEGNYGEDANYDTALFYYNQISDPDFSFLKSRKREIEKAKASFANIQLKAKQNDPDALRTLANAYKYGNYGKKVDQKKWLEYLEKSAKFNQESALEELIDYYQQDQYLNANKAKILGYYDQLAAIGSKDYTRKLAHQYLNGSQLVEPNRQKAREYYLKAGSWGNEFIKYMDDYDIGMKMLNESPSAKYKVGRAYFYGQGVKEDRLEAAKYLKQASDEGNDHAIALYSEMRYMGVLNEEKNAWVMEPDWDEAIIYLRKHSNPKRVDDYIEAYETLVVPAKKGDRTAYIKLGDWYSSRGRDLAAQDWYKKSIAAGNLAAHQPLDSVTKDNQEKRQNYVEGAAKGDLFSKVQLARTYLYDNKILSGSPEYDLAIQYLQEGMKSADDKVSNNAFDALVDLYRDGIKDKKRELNRPKDEQKYLALLLSEENTRTKALINLYYYYVNSDNAKALTYLQRAYDKGDLSATEKLYQIYYPGQYCGNSDNVDMDKASQYLKEWIEKSNFQKNTDKHYIHYPESLSKEMGTIYLKGDCDIDKNIDKAIEWYQISLNYHPTHALDAIYQAYVEKGDVKQAYYYALQLDKKPSSIELMDTLSAQDKQAIEKQVADEKAYEKYGRFAEQIEKQRVEAEAGDKMSAFSLGIAYARGERVPEDTQKMIYYYELAGKNGYPRAYNILGNLYRKDNERGIEKDFPKALYYFDLGAQQNDSNTAHLAGDMLYFGQGVPKDYVRAAKYYDMTDLEQGTHHAMAKYKLAYMYYNGWVGTKSKDDIQKAHDYLELGAKYQDKDSINALKEWDFSLIN